MQLLLKGMRKSEFIKPWQSGPDNTPLGLLQKPEMGLGSGNCGFHRGFFEVQRQLAASGYALIKA